MSEQTGCAPITVSGEPFSGVFNLVLRPWIRWAIPWSCEFLSWWQKDLLWQGQVLMSEAKQSESQLKSVEVWDQASTATSVGVTWNMGVIQDLWPQCPDPGIFCMVGIELITVFMSSGTQCLTFYSKMSLLRDHRITEWFGLKGS